MGVTEIDARNIGEKPSVDVAEAIANLAGIEITDFSLYRSVSPEVLDTLLDPTKSGIESASVKFTVLHYNVVVERSGSSIHVIVKDGRPISQTTVSP